MNIKLINRRIYWISVSCVRLGGGEKDAEEVKQHSFFKSINFQDLYDRKVSVVELVLFQML